MFVRPSWVPLSAPPRSIVLVLVSCRMVVVPEPELTLLVPVPSSVMVSAMRVIGALPTDVILFAPPPPRTMPRLPPVAVPVTVMDPPPELMRAPGLLLSTPFTKTPKLLPGPPVPVTETVPAPPEVIRPSRNIWMPKLFGPLPPVPVTVTVPVPADVIVPLWCGITPTFPPLAFVPPVPWTTTFPLPPDVIKPPLTGITP